jgi:hypothetical protein
VARVVVTSELPGGALETLRAEHDVTVLDGAGHVTDSELARAVRDAEA